METAEEVRPSYEESAVARTDQLGTARQELLMQPDRLAELPVLRTERLTLRHGPGSGTDIAQCFQLCLGLGRERPLTLRKVLSMMSGQMLEALLRPAANQLVPFG